VPLPDKAAVQLTAPSGGVLPRSLAVLGEVLWAPAAGAPAWSCAGGDPVLAREAVEAVPVEIRRDTPER